MTPLMPADLTVVIDTREQLPWDFPGMKTKRESLPFGDYTVDGYQKRLIAVERKTAEMSL